MDLHIATTITINASATKVWEVFSMFNSYNTWNPFIKSLDGDVAVGNTITVKIDEMTFKPVVLSFQPNKELSWKGKLFIKGLFDGTHSFYLTENEGGTTTFVQKEDFSGWLVALFQKKLMTDTRLGFEKMNEALKARVEQA